MIGPALASGSHGIFALGFLARTREPAFWLDGGEGRDMKGVPPLSDEADLLRNVARPAYHHLLSGHAGRPSGFAGAPGFRRATRARAVAGKPHARAGRRV